MICEASMRDAMKFRYRQPRTTGSSRCLDNHTGPARATANNIVTCLLRDDDKTRVALSTSEFPTIANQHEYDKLTVSTKSSP